MNIKNYNHLRKIRDTLKLITQLSYNISVIDKRFPLENLSDAEYDTILKVYYDFLKEYEEIRLKLLKILK